MRKCGICHKGLRDGEHPEPVRVASEGTDPICVSALKLAEGVTAVAPGLYSGCADCVSVLRPFIAARLGKPVEALTANELV